MTKPRAYAKTEKRLLESSLYIHSFLLVSMRPSNLSYSHIFRAISDQHTRIYSYVPRFGASDRILFSRSQSCKRLFHCCGCKQLFVHAVPSNNRIIMLRISVTTSMSVSPVALVFHISDLTCHQRQRSESAPKPGSHVRIMLPPTIKP